VAPVYTRDMPHRLTVADIMTSEVITLAEDDTLADARASMEHGRVRHLPVVREDRLVGLVTHRDLLAASVSVLAQVTPTEQHRHLARVPVRELMHDAVTASPAMPVREAAGLLLANQFGCLPVVDGGSRLMGIVTETDFLRLAIRLLDAIRA
jgi:CBS domain-containing membrane protein